MLEEVDDCNEDPVPNPLFSGGRGPEDVFLTGIGGVPTALLQATENVPGRPAVEDGFRYKLASELDDSDWDTLLGDPGSSPPVAPTSPFMLESELQNTLPSGSVTTNTSETVRPFCRSICKAGRISSAVEQIALPAQPSHFPVSVYVQPK